MDSNSKSDIIRRSAEELRQRVEAHCRLLAVDKRKGGECEPRTGPIRPQVWDCTDAQKLRAAIVEAISVLDSTRRSFKSRQLEELRKRLTKALL